MSSETFHVQAFIFVIILIVYVLTSHVIENKKVPYAHESSIAILMGIITAIISKYVYGKQINFSNDLFFTIILPPIIFSAGYSLRKSLFFQNFGIISFLGIVGTVMGFLLLAGYLIVINNIFEVLTMTQVLILSSVLCATDTVAANSLIKAEKFPVLNAVLFGQGILNDAVAIILFGTVSKLKLDEIGGQLTFKVVEEMFLDFSYLFFFSVAFGTLSGFGLSYLFKTYESINKHPIKETSLILLNGYLTYLMGELMGLSGIITLFTCAIIMGHYSFMNISQQSQKGTGLAFETVSYIAEAFVFTYLGASVFSTESEWVAFFIAALILLSLPVIRAIMVFILPLIYKLLNKKFILSTKQLKICWYSGIIRGVIAFALCFHINTEHKKLIITITLFIVMITTIFGSSFMQNFAKWIRLEESINKAETEPITSLGTQKDTFINSIASKYKNIGGLGQEDNFNLSQPKRQKGAFEKIQTKYLKPLFGKQQAEDLQMTYSLQEDKKRQLTDRKIQLNQQQLS